MDEIEAGDWRARLKAYQNILQMMINPSDELLSQLLSNLPNYIADIHPNCQRVALLICEKFFEVSPYINYPQISQVLINNCLGAKQQSVDLAISLISKCLHENRKEVTQQLFSSLEKKATPVILSVISIIVAHLATLTSQDAQEAFNIIEHLKPLLNNPDTKVVKEAESAIAAAKFVAGSDLDTLNSSVSNVNGGNSGEIDSNSNNINSDMKPKIDDQHWISLISSSNWKDRKIGYEELLNSIDETSRFNVIEHNFVVPAGTEKNMICEGVVVQIIEKLAITFKSMLFKKLQGYVNPIINIMSQKRQQSRILALQNAFDAIALNVVSSPYEPPFVDFLLKMLTSQSPRLKEEGIAFLIRCNVTPISNSVIDALQQLTSDPSHSIRESASNAYKLKCGNNPAQGGGNGNPGNYQGDRNSPHSDANEANDKPEITRSTKSKSNRLVSPDVRRQSRRKQSIQSTKAAWENWVNPETLQLLGATQWGMVTKGLDALQNQFEQDPSQPSAVVVGLSSMFMGKTFTPKVMVNLMQHLLNYMKYDPEKLTDDALTYAVNFAVDKIQDKRFEQPVFEILDSAAEANSAQFVFQILYQQLPVKNPAIPNRILTYFAHHLANYEINAGINIEEFAQQIQPLFNHSDQSVRKAANECFLAVKNFDPEAAAEYFKYVKTNRKREIKKSPSQASDSNQEKPSKSESKIPKGRSEIPVSQRGIRSASPTTKERHSSQQQEKNQQNQDKLDRQRQMSPQRGIFPQRLILAIAKSGSIIETRKALDEMESILNNQLENVGESTVPASEFTEFYNRARQWFKDANTTIVLLITKVIALSFKAIIVEQITSVSLEFLCDVCLLLNITNKGIRSAALSALTQLDSIHPAFVPNIFLPAFPKLNVEGRKAGVSFLKTLHFDMNVQQYYSLIINFLADKNESFRESAKPLIEQFLQLPNSLETLKSAAEGFTPAQKFQVLNRLAEYEKDVQYVTQAPNQQQQQQPKQQFQQPRQQQNHHRLFKCIPNLVDKEQRERILDPFLPLKVLNNEEKTDVLLEILQKYVDKYFYDSDTIVSTETEAIQETCANFVEIMNNEPDRFSLILDIILLWWANQALLIKVQEGFDEIIQFLDILLADLDKKNRMLSQFEFSIILPTVLECLGRDESQWESIRQALFKICDINELMATLVHLLSIVSSVFTIVATFRTLMIIIPEIEDVTPYENDLRRHTKKIHSIVSSDIEGNQELYDVTILFTEFLNELDQERNQQQQQLEEMEQNEEQEELLEDENNNNNNDNDYDENININNNNDIIEDNNNNENEEINNNNNNEEDLNEEINNNNYDEDEEDQQQQQQQQQIFQQQRKQQQYKKTNSNNNSRNTSNNNNNVIVKPVEEVEKEIEIPRIDYSQQVKVSTCELSDFITEQINSPFLLVYRWITDLCSDDAAVSIKSMKSITSQMKKDYKVFENHLDPLVISLIAKMHIQFSANPLQVRLCKYVSFCILTLFSETPLKEKISQKLVQQIIYELLTHLSNGISEPVLNQVLNAIIVKLMEDCQMKSFYGLLSAIGEFENIEHFSDKWLRLALKCFEACGVRLCEIGNQTDIVSAILKIDEFFEEHPQEEIQEAPVGQKILKTINNFISLIGKNFSYLLDSPDITQTLSKSPLLQMLKQPGEESF